VGHHQIQKSKSTKFYAMMIDLQRAENCPELANIKSHVWFAIFE
jgi:hypothetical protein